MKILKKDGFETKHIGSTIIQKPTPYMQHDLELTATILIDGSPFFLEYATGSLRGDYAKVWANPYENIDMSSQSDCIFCEVSDLQGAKPTKKNLKDLSKAAGFEITEETYYRLVELLKGTFKLAKAWFKTYGAPFDNVNDWQNHEYASLKNKK